MNIKKDIKNATDIDYLKQLNNYIDMDIENVDKDSHIISKMKADREGVSIEDYKKKLLKHLNKIKKLTLNQINEIEKNKLHNFENFNKK